MVDRPLLRECNGNSTAIQQRPPRHPDVDVITTLWNSDRAMEAGFTEPRREILDLPHFTRWLQSRAYVEYKGFIETLNDSVTGKKVSEVGPLSERVIRVVEMLNTVQGWIRELPPDTTRAQRFGNTRFRDWVKRLEEMSEMLLMDLLPERSHPAIVELKAYLEQSFGNSARIDYGSGHEMYFVVWLFCMSKIGYFAPSDGPAMVLVLFSKYLDVVRDLQRTYNLEPAGSHGVWGLDDYQFLPYYFGSAQFI
ncbi:Serine/threonine-protein phosphatase 2A activator, partial [Spiromyces aspiralis]